MSFSALSLIKPLDGAVVAVCVVTVVRHAVMRWRCREVVLLEAGLADVTVVDRQLEDGGCNSGGGSGNSHSSSR